MTDSNHPPPDRPDAATDPRASRERGQRGAAPDDRDAAPRSPADGAGAAAGGSAGRRHGGEFGDGRLYRAVFDEIDRLRSEFRNQFFDLRSEVHEQFRHDLGETNTHIAEILPRLQDLESSIAELTVAVRDGAVPPPTRNPITDPSAGLTDAPAEAPAAVATPSIGWDAMSHGETEQAWAALGDFVETVLYRQYRFTRLQIPDCWALHPRMVREIAWLRSAYLEDGTTETTEPAAAVPWHIRCIPGFLINAAEAIDPRECRPGIHRLTEAEVSRFAVAGATADREGGPAAVLTSETGHDRPHLIPANYPTRVTKSTVRRGGDQGPQAPTVDGLPDLLVGTCEPRFWRPHHHAAALADLAERD